MQGIIQNKADMETEKSIYHDFTKFGDSSPVPNLLKQLIAIIWAYLDTIQKTLVWLLTLWFEQYLHEKLHFWISTLEIGNEDFLPGIRISSDHLILQGSGSEKIKFENVTNATECWLECNSRLLSN